MTPHVTGRALRFFCASLTLACAASASAETARLLSSTDDARFRAAGKVQMASGRCTASVIAGSSTPDPAKPALLLTAGHCATEGQLGGTTVIDQPLTGVTFTPAYFFDNVEQHETFSVDRILYASTGAAELAVLRLKATYGELLSRGIHPLTVTAPGQVAGLDIETPHIPALITDGPLYLRHSVCRSSGPDRVYGFGTLWNVAGTNCEGGTQGSSGAAVLRKGSSEIIGVLSASNDLDDIDIGFECYTLSCLAGTEPAERVTIYQTLLTPALVASLHADGSWTSPSLARSNGVSVTRTTAEDTRLLVNEEGAWRPARWGLRVDDGHDLIRFKHGSVASVDCADPRGYSRPVPSGDQPMDQLPLTPKEGTYVMCVVGKSGSDTAWQPFDQATVLTRAIDETAPRGAPRFHLIWGEPGISLIEVHVGVSASERMVEPSGKGFEHYIGPRDTTDCTEDDRYQPVNGYIEAYIDAEPLRVCARRVDAAGNHSAFASYDVL